MCAGQLLGEDVAVADRCCTNCGHELRAGDAQQGRGQQPRSDAGRAQEGARRPWWRRVFGG
jgi:hypothetical protein